MLKSVIAGMVNFWISAFIIPQGCINKIESLCSRFLWSGNVDNPKTVKVSGKSCCLPMDEGGLGLRRFSIWNKALCLRFIWRLFSESDSLWVAWHKHYSLCLSSKSFWEIDEKANDSWTWKGLLKLRPLARQFIRGVLGNGLKLSFWFDSWSPFGPLLTYFGRAGPWRLRVPLNAKIADIVDSNGWKLPPPRTEEALNLQIHLTTLRLPSLTDPNDVYEWVSERNGSNQYSSANAWDSLRPRRDKQQWADLIWYKGYIPKFAFTMWVANYNRLPTRSRLASWGMLVPPDCCLCSTMDETRDHLLLTCDYSMEVWRIVLARIRPNFTLFTSWNELLSWLRGNSSRGPKTLRKLVAHATVFHLWKQRNNVLHNQTSLPSNVVFNGIYKDVKNSISARRKRKGFHDLMPLWI